MIDNSRYEERLIPSRRFQPGVWLVTRCIENGKTTEVDLGWKDSGQEGSYCHIGTFAHESEAHIALDVIETMPPVNDSITSITNAGFVRLQAAGLSHGQDVYIRKSSGNRPSVLLDLDGMNGSRLYLSVFGDTHRIIEIATLPLYVTGTKLAELGRPLAVAVTVLCALLESRAKAGDITHPTTQSPSDMFTE